MPYAYETTDVAGDRTTTHTLEPDQNFAGGISVWQDEDWFAVELTAGQTYSFGIVGMGAERLNAAAVTLWSETGWWVERSYNTGHRDSLTFTATETGTYYLAVSGDSAYDTGDYVISMTTGDHAEFDADMGAAALHSGVSWSERGAGAVVTWAARETSPYQTDGQGNGTPLIPLTASQIAATAFAMQQWAEAADITFQRVNPDGYSDDADILVGAYSSATDGAGAYAWYPGTESYNGDISLNNYHLSNFFLPQGSYDFMAVVHEVGHAIGLSHPGDYNGVGTTYDEDAIFADDSHQYTLMSYFSADSTGASFTSFPDTLMLLDVLAVQQLYGVNHATRAGDTVYGFGTTEGSLYNFAINRDPVMCIWDGGGIDTLNLSGYLDDQTVRLTAGAFSDVGGLTGALSIAYGAVIENAVGGSGNDTLIGNDVGNMLDGGAGADRMIGGLGDDTYHVRDSRDVVVELAGGGADTIVAWRNISLGDFANVENATAGGTVNRNLTGDGHDNVLTGNAARNLLDGGRGADTLIGGVGDDIYNVDSTRDVIVEMAGEGVDLVFSTVSFNLTGQAVEHATLIGSLDRNLIGNDGDNVLTGNVGRNIISGGLGRDALFGGAEADRFDFNRVGDSTASAYDRIYDLEAHDVIDLSGIDANTRLTGNQAFVMVDALSGMAGQLTRVLTGGGNTLVQGDVNGDGVADFRLLLVGDHRTFEGWVL